MKSEGIHFQAMSSGAGQEIRPETVPVCSLLKLNLQIDYSLARFFGHATPLEVRVSRADTTVLETRLVPIEVNKPFSTYVSIIPSNQFYTVFRHASVPQTAWDKLQIESHATDWASVTPSAIRIDHIDCVTF
jgi:hypothetical protein